jgi:DNA-binding response OmpR family regulator
MNIARRILSICYDHALVGTRTLVLRSGGHTVCDADNLAAALLALESQPFDVIVLGTQLPEVDCEAIYSAAITMNPSVTIMLLGPSALNCGFGHRAVVLDLHRPQDLLQAIHDLPAPQK